MDNRPKVLSIRETKYPLDYDKNSKGDYQEWKKYIHNELLKQIGPGPMFLVELTKFVTKAPERKPVTKEEKVYGDRVIYILMFAAAVAFAIVTSIV
jgi:hypothetical protein